LRNYWAKVNVNLMILKNLSFSVLQKMLKPVVAKAVRGQPSAGVIVVGFVGPGSHLSRRHG
jgi:hypothetical protein